MSGLFIIDAIDEQIARLQQVRELLAGVDVLGAGQGVGSAEMPARQMGKRRVPPAVAEGRRVPKRVETGEVAGGVVLNAEASPAAKQAVARKAGARRGGSVAGRHGRPAPTGALLGAIPMRPVVVRAAAVGGDRAQRAEMGAAAGGFPSGAAEVEGTLDALVRELAAR